MQQINLYRPPPKRSFTLLDARGMTLVLVIALATLGGLAAWLHHEGRQERARVTALVGELESLGRELARMSGDAGDRSDPALAAALEDLTRQLVEKPRMLRLLTGEDGANTRGFSTYLEALARRRPEGVWLTGFTLASGGREVSVTGAATEAGLAPLYLEQLAGEPGFAGTAFKRFHLQRDDGAAGSALRFGFSNRALAEAKE